MNGVDYTKQLAKDRDYFQDTIQKNNKANERRLAETNERNDLVQNKQKETFIEDKADLEKNYQKNLDQLKEKTASALNNSNDKMAQQLEEEREAFTHDSSIKSRDFEKRLNDIKSSYDKSFKAEREGHQNIQDGHKKRYDHNVSDLTKKVDDKIASTQNEMHHSVRKVHDNLSAEKRDLVRGHEDRLAKLQHDELVEKNEIKNHLQSNYEKASKLQKEDAERMRNYLEANNIKTKEEHKQQFIDLAEDYGHQTKNTVGKQQLEAQKTDVANKNQIADLKKEYAKKLHESELFRRRNDTGDGKYAEVVARQRGLQDDDTLNRKIDTLEGRLTESQRHYQDRADRDQRAFNDTLHGESLESTLRLEKKLGEANADKIVAIADEREQAQRELGVREHLHTIDKISFGNSMMLERTNSKDRMEKLKETYNKSMKELEEKHKVALDDVTKVANEDKSVFIKKTNEARTKELFEMRRAFDKMMDSTVQDYEQRLAKYQRENDYLKLSMNQKVQNIVDQTDKQIESQRVMFENRRLSDIKAQQIMMDQQQSQAKSEINQITINFQKKIDKLQMDNETKLKLLTNDYENKLKEVQASKVKELSEKELASQMELQRLKNTLEQEKKGLIQNYEEQISTMKVAQKDQLQQMSDFKKLS
ncbi:MAG: hypothetical protein AB7I27_19250 [Bacteriovoracaceae bacterium]